MLSCVIRLIRAFRRVLRFGPSADVKEAQTFRPPFKEREMIRSKTPPDAPRPVVIRLVGIFPVLRMSFVLPMKVETSSSMVLLVLSIAS